ncbi:glycoside hydrolase family 79 protein [Crepidotus variabilis]|uniref:Glycoside hydrolase family 79 protein n=1 Tax=Crepidotus variabilis TaxID=179855 RepID=A0A9P6ET11_9AGAR|nr:glycoside hydrolase family 79 protein [Crepidotus variabilis]
MSSFIFLLLCLQLSLAASVDPISVIIPTKPTSTHSVRENFLGISFELSFVDEYFGNDSTTIPSTFVTYLNNLRSRVSNNPVRIRIGGNSMDTSKYISTQKSPMIQRIGTAAASADNQPVNYGPVLWDVLSKVSTSVGGVNYLVGLSLEDPNDLTVPKAAGDSYKALGSSLEAYLLGNEPDLYGPHGFRQGTSNYAPSNYMDEFQTASGHLSNTTSGNLLSKNNLAGPTICCNWGLDTLINGGYISRFGNILEYISLQHYPQNNCFGSYQYNNTYYIQHSNVVDLAQWSKPGLDLSFSNNKKVILSEFNSASCGGIEGISNTFAVGSLWTIDYALQLAAVGYTAAYIHTREKGISYNVFAPPDGPSGASGPWTTNPPFYALMVVAEALQSKSGDSIVVDLNIGGPYSGYAVHDASDKTVQQLVFFNFANVSASAGLKQTFKISSNTFASSTSKKVTVKYLVGNSMLETKNIGWGGQTLAGVGDAKMISSSQSWAPANKPVDCSNGCSIDVPAPGLAVVFAGGNVSSTQSSTSSRTSITNIPSQTTQSTLSSSSVRFGHEYIGLLLTLVLVIKHFIGLL